MLFCKNYSVVQKCATALELQYICHTEIMELLFKNKKKVID